MDPESIDFIGDVHGHAEALERLLAELGYAPRGGAWRHASRHAVLLGDLIDRGPDQLGVVGIARRMRDAGAATVLMGNHEYNALAWGAGTRDRTPSNLRQHGAFLDAVGEGSGLHRELLGWFATLPLWIDRPAFAAVHACWDPAAVAALAPQAGPDAVLTGAGLDRALARTGPARDAVETLLKGPEADLPPGVGFADPYGHRRTRTRVAWWGGAATFREAAIVDAETRRGIPDLPLPDSARVAPAGGRPVFFGHYWMEGAPVLQGPRHACLDFSVAKGNALAAYRFDGERTLCPSRLRSVPAEPAAAPGP